MKLVTAKTRKLGPQKLLERQAQQDYQRKMRRAEKELESLRMFIQMLRDLTR